MVIEQTSRGFERLITGEGEVLRQSSVIGDYPDAFDKPGSSALWFGSQQLDRSQVIDLIEHLTIWLQTGSLEKPTNLPEPPSPGE